MTSFSILRHRSIWSHFVRLRHICQKYFRINVISSKILLFAPLLVMRRCNPFKRCAILIVGNKWALFTARFSKDWIPWSQNKIWNSDLLTITPWPKACRASRAHCTTEANPAPNVVSMLILCRDVKKPIFNVETTLLISTLKKQRNVEDYSLLSTSEK